MDWQAVALLPREVACTWATLVAKDTVINHNGETIGQAPMKDWQPGWTVVVGTIRTIGMEERLNALGLLDDDVCVLYLSDQSRPVKKLKLKRKKSKIGE